MMRIPFSRKLTEKEVREIREATAGHSPFWLPSLMVNRRRLGCRKCPEPLGTFGMSQEEDGKIIGRWIGHIASVAQRKLGRPVELLS